MERIKRISSLWNLTQALVLSLLLTMTGCGTPPIPLDPDRVQQLSKTPYPKDSEVVDLDIVVKQEEQAIVLTNRTATAYHGVRVWLNQQYVCPPQTVPIGTPTRIELIGFINEHREAYPTGGFLTPDKAFPVVLAELYQAPAPSQADPSEHAGVAGKRYRLLVRRQAP